MTACACELTPYGASCSCPSGTVTLDTRDVLDLPRADLEQLTELTAEIGDANQRGDTAEAGRLKIERDNFQRDALARFQTALEGHGRTDSTMYRTDDPKTDADGALDEDLADQRRRRRQAVRDAQSMGLDPVAAGERFDADEIHRTAQDAAMHARAARRARDAERADANDDAGVDW